MHRRCMNDNNVFVVVNKNPEVSPMSAWTLPRSRAIRKIRSIRLIRVPQSEEAHQARFG